jgi:hypothetical protein
MRLGVKLRVFLVLFSLAAIVCPLSFTEQEPTAPSCAPNPTQPSAAPPSPAGQSQDQTSPEEGQQKPAAGDMTGGRVKTTPKKRKRITPGTRNECGKVVVSNGGAKEDAEQLAPGMTKEQQVQERENTNQHLATTDANLKTMAGRQLTPAEKNMLSQIRSYVSQSKAASDAGDLVRANTLASKAHLLSDELAKK